MDLLSWSNAYLSNAFRIMIPTTSHPSHRVADVAVRAEPKRTGSLVAFSLGDDCGGSQRLHISGISASYTDTGDCENACLIFVPHDGSNCRLFTGGDIWGDFEAGMISQIAEDCHFQTTLQGPLSLTFGGVIPPKMSGRMELIALLYGGDSTE